MQYLYWLDHLQPQDRPLVGEAAYALGLASQQGYPVLPGVIIAAPMFMHFLESVDWVDPLFSDFPHSPIHLDVNQPSQLQAIAQRIQDLIQAQALPNAQQRDIYEAVQSLQTSHIILRPSLGLASNYQALDSLPNHSIPPLFTTAQSLLQTLICESNHSPMIMDAIRQIWGSVFRASHLFYWRRLGIPFHQLRLGIVICPVTSALSSGTLNIDSQKAEIEAIWGLVSGLTNGDTQSDIYKYEYHDEEWRPAGIHIRDKRYAQTLPLPTSGITATPQTLSPTSSSELSSQALIPEDESSFVHPSYSTSIGVEINLIPPKRVRQPVLDEALLDHLITKVQGLTHQLEHHGNDALTLEWAIYPTWTPISPSGDSPPAPWQKAPDNTENSPISTDLDQSLEPQAIHHPLGKWSSSSTSRDLLMGNGILDLSSLVIDHQSYSLYVTAILARSRDIGTELEKRAIESNTFTSAVDIALDHERFRTLPSSPSMTASAGEYLSEERVTVSDVDSSHSGDTHLVGIGTSPGQVTAPLWVMKETLPLTKNIPDDHILLTNSISPVWLNAMRGAKGVISTQGGMTCHAAILARELGIPSVMGVTDAMTQFETGDWIILDGDRGTVTLLPPTPIPVSPQSIQTSAQTSTTGSSTFSSGERSSKERDKTLAIHHTSPIDKASSCPKEQKLRGRGTATQLMLSLSQTHQIEALAQQPIDGIGLIRAEIMLASLLHHQSIQTWLTPDHRSLLVQTIYHHIKQFAQAFFPRPSWYRTLDMRSHEWIRHSSPQGTEINPLLGMHGTMSYQQAPGFFMAELEAIRLLQLEGVTNINLILPFVRTVEEFQFCHNIIEEMGLLDQDCCDVWIMAEVPSVLMLLPDYVHAGIKGIAIGSNDLSQLLLATDRTNPTMHQALQTPHPAILRAIKMLIKTARQANIPCSLCGELASQHPEVIEDLIRWGVTTISVSPNATAQTHREILRAEKRLFLEWGRGIEESGDRSFPTDLFTD